MQQLIKCFNISYRKKIQNNAIIIRTKPFHLHSFSMSDKINFFNLSGKSLGDVSPLKVQKQI